ncbi:hypothetical protein CEN50_07770 [Fischerella thermalis CCMEE 5268]|uniref:Uncharacterized protein n=1 Tax=Fischerella thermalis CCMEE 5268 TaxID=2019662 RepID=A0A2N6KIG5_9CYAN|nr:hypothetical protein [Fischerella thermalis]PLZ99285.1 hypothetical protein CEN50_07770 [Fischerella thermalis CCMEE 5268]
MQVAVIEEDLQFIAQILQEQLRAEIPSGEFFQVKCAVKNDQLMILVQHPQGVSADTDNIFAVLEEALRSLLNQHGQRVEIFLRITGVKLPYAKYSLVLQGLEAKVEQAVGEEEKIDNSSPFTTSDSLVDDQSPTNTPNEPEDQLYDPMADAPDLSFYTTIKSRRPIKPIVLGVAVSGIAVLGAAAYLLTRPCVMFECKEIHTAEDLQKSWQRQIQNANSESELIKVQQQLVEATSALKTIPAYSPRYQEAETLATNLSRNSETINKVVKAFGAASLATQKSQTPANSLEELKARQKLWRQAIAPLETISVNNELYGLVQPRLGIYRAKLRTVNQQLQLEDKWLKKITAAKNVANAATKQETTAKTLSELQKVQSTWQVAINALSIIPKTSSVYSEAQQLLIEYKPKLVAARDRATQQLLAAKTYKQAIENAEQAKRYEKQNQWQAAVTYWNQALSAAKQVKEDSLYYTQAQTLIQPYSTSLKQAETKLQVANSLQQTRTDLENTCSGVIRVCNFTITDREIIVRMTPEYEQALNSNLNHGNQSTVANITSHLESLQQALDVISDNANLAVVVFDAQGSQIHGHVPGR